IPRRAYMDTYTEVTSVSWFGRLKNSVLGVLFGLLFFFGSFILLGWNERNSVITARSLEEGKGAVVSVSADRVEPGNEGKLIHLMGQATTDEILSDTELGVSLNAIKLRRQAEMYQWEEHSSSKTRKKLGGGEETVTEYRYEKTWADDVINSSNFKTGGHANPGALPMGNAVWTAQRVMLGAFMLSPKLLDKIAPREYLQVTDDMLSKLSPAWRGKMKTGLFQLASNQNCRVFFIGQDPTSPQIGDTRVALIAAKPAPYSIVAKQTAASFQPYQTKAGKPNEMLREGQVDADAMFAMAFKENAIQTWILRGVGFAVMLIGLLMITSPLKILADFVPFIGSLVGGGLFVLSLAIAVPLTLLTIAVCWFAFRPMLSGGLILLAAAAFVGIKMMFKKARG
ncbi:MAG: TMEM43 family protein, partial [Candidatus Sumerlaeota bacterium]|nr:TMEM43 family protein [Candidatus Sumerlaeota bacterium]